MYHYFSNQWSQTSLLHRFMPCYSGGLWALCFGLVSKQGARTDNDGYSNICRIVWKLWSDCFPLIICRCCPPLTLSPSVCWQSFSGFLTSAALKKTDDPQVLIVVNGVNSVGFVARFFFFNSFAVVVLIFPQWHAEALAYKWNVGAYLEG